MSEHEDETEAPRRALTTVINAYVREREALEAAHGQVWDSDELRQDFEVTGFLAPFVGVRRKKDGVMGMLMFQHDPRFYWGWTEDR